MMNAPFKPVLLALSLLWMPQQPPEHLRGKLQDVDRMPRPSEHLRGPLQDIDWMKMASQTHVAEIAAGKLAALKAFRADVRVFADSIVANHDTAETELLDISRKEGVVLPDSSDTRQHEKLQALSRLTGASFDTAFIRLEIGNDEKAIQLFQQELAVGLDMRVREYAQKYLPMLRLHLSRARDFGIVISPEVRVISLAAPYIRCNTASPSPHHIANQPRRRPLNIIAS